MSLNSPLGWIFRRAPVLETTLSLISNYSLHPYSFWGFFSPTAFYMLGNCLRLLSWMRVSVLTLAPGFMFCVNTDAPSAFTAGFNLRPLQCWRGPPPLREEGWMWCIEGSQGRNIMGTSPPWVSTSLDRPINLGAESRRSSLARAHTVWHTLGFNKRVCFCCFLTNTLRHPHGESKHQESQAGSDGIFPP